MRTQSCKAKGRRLQQLIARDLLAMYPHLTEDDIRSTSMGAPGEDIQLSQAAQQTIPFSFEAKNQERVNIWAAIEQALGNTRKTRTPCVVIKKNNVKPFAVVPWETLLSLLAGRRTAVDPCPREEESLTVRLEAAQRTITQALFVLSGGDADADGDPSEQSSL
tara:strand:- start:25 stop:513 length:489 start_codon:yes stop_codon:yes gene_type:complete